MFVYAFGTWLQVLQIFTVGYQVIYKGENVFVLDQDVEGYCQE